MRKQQPRPLGRKLPQLSPHTLPLLKILAHNTNNLSKLVWRFLYYVSVYQTHYAIGLGFPTLISLYIIRDTCLLQQLPNFDTYLYLF